MKSWWIASSSGLAAAMAPMRSSLTVTVAVSLSISITLSRTFRPFSGRRRSRPRNMIVTFTFARWFKGAPLSFDSYRVGAIQTYIADSVIADSAPAASAIDGVTLAACQQVGRPIFFAMAIIILAFVPVFTDSLVKEGEGKAWKAHWNIMPPYMRKARDCASLPIFNRCWGRYWRI